MKVVNRQDAYEERCTLQEGNKKKSGDLGDQLPQANVVGGEMK